MGWASKSNPTIHEGTDAGNHCTGGGGSDSMYGYGGNDDLYGGGDRDKIRGATGSDFLSDSAGGNDNDSTCDGGGGDGVYLLDGDTRADGHFLANDGYEDQFTPDPGESAHIYSGSCPIPSP